MRPPLLARLLLGLPLLLLGLLACVNVTTNTIAASSHAPALPSWFTVVLGVALPWLLQCVCRRLPSWLKPVIAYGTAALVAAAAGFAFAGWRSLGDLARNLPALWTSMQIVYSLIRKPLQDAADERAARRQRLP